jgi:hypothetical protein
MRCVVDCRERPGENNPARPASMAAIESTLDSRVNRLLGDAIQQMVDA